MATLTREKVERIVKEARENEKPPNLFRANLREASLSRTDLSGADLSRATLIAADLFRANLSEAKLRGANLNGADLSGADLSRADLFAANFSGANLSGVNLSDVDLSEANLRGTNLSGANLSGAYLNGASLYEANLRWADLRWADLNEINLSKVVVSDVAFGNIDLSEVKGLDTVQHEGPSYIDTHTLQLSKGQIPEVFLRGCGLSDVQIEMAKLHNPDLTQNQIIDITYKISNLLADKALQFYSCFISYSSKDHTFAQRLHDDLQNNGVRCWFAPEDMKIGDKIRSRIDESIRLHDKLLLVLSEHSVASGWVEHEVEHALDLEIERGEPVLFPIRLDEAVNEIKTGWAAKVKRERHIGDFSQCGDDEVYQHGFVRLLRDLQVSEETLAD